MKKTLICLLCVVSVSAFAKGYSPAVTARPGGYNVKYASDGTPLATPVSAGATGGPQISGGGGLTLPGGVQYPFTAVSVITAASMLTPWGSAIGLAVAAGSIGVAILDAALADAKVKIVAGKIQIANPNGSASSPSCPTRAQVPPYSTADASITYTLICLPTAPGSTTYFYGYSKTAPDYGWPGASFPCGNRSCETGYVFEAYGYIYGALPPEPSFKEATVAEAAAVMTARSPSAAEVQAIVDLGFPPVPELPVMTGPASVFKGNVVQLGLDGTVTEIEERYIASFNPGVIGIGVETKQTVTTPQKVATTTTTNPDGSVVNAVTTTPKVSTTISTTSPLPVEKPDPITCGLPTTPACKLDETGTPSGVGVFEPTKTAIDVAKTSAVNNIGEAASIAAPAWSFSFALPTGCAPYVTGIKGVVLNVCQYQSTIHGLLSVIWAAATAFAMIGMVGRTIREA